MKTIIDDGFMPYLVRNAEFDGDLEIPIIKNNKFDIIPKDMIPFNKRMKFRGQDCFIHFYTHDREFKQVLTATKKYLDELKVFSGVISPDCSLYRDMPLVLQIANVYMSRAVGIYFQNNGIPVIPNVRWGDERSFEFCFLGLEKGGIYCISTHGCIKSRVDKNYFKVGLEKMIEFLNPRAVLVHGRMPKSIFGKFSKHINFINYHSYIRRVKDNLWEHRNQEDI